MSYVYVFTQSNTGYDEYKLKKKKIFCFWDHQIRNNKRINVII